MTEDVIIKEIMWEYNCSKHRAQELVEKYKRQKKYDELCKLIKYKKAQPEF